MRPQFTSHIIFGIVLINGFSSFALADSPFRFGHIFRGSSHGVVTPDADDDIQVIVVEPKVKQGGVVQSRQAGSKPLEGLKPTSLARPSKLAKSNSPAIPSHLVKPPAPTINNDSEVVTILVDTEVPVTSPSHFSDEASKSARMERAFFKVKDTFLPTSDGALWRKRKALDKTLATQPKFSKEDQAKAEKSLLEAQEQIKWAQHDHLGARFREAGLPIVSGARRPHISTDQAMKNFHEGIDKKREAQKCLTNVIAVLEQQRELEDVIAMLKKRGY